MNCFRLSFSTFLFWVFLELITWWYPLSQPIWVASADAQSTDHSGSASSSTPSTSIRPIPGDELETSREASDSTQPYQPRLEEPVRQDLSPSSSKNSNADQSSSSVDQLNKESSQLSPSESDKGLSSVHLEESSSEPCLSAINPGGKIEYLLERVEVKGNTITSADVIKSFVSIEIGNLFYVDDPSIEHVRWRLMGTGWFDDVRLSLERGSKRGWAVLIIEVRERNTLVITRIVAGLSKEVQRKMKGEDQEAYTDLPYAGLGIAESNLFGLGIGTAISAAYSGSQGGIDFRYNDPFRLGEGFGLQSRLFYNHGREFFGKDEDGASVSGECPGPDTPDYLPECDVERKFKAAVVHYDRFGLSIGTGRDISSSLHYTIDWQGELVDVTSKPEDASIMRGAETVPIDFHIEDNKSVISSLNVGLIFDRRDDPLLPSRGHLAQFTVRVGARWLGSRYDFVRNEVSFRYWQPFSWGHIISFGLYAGAVYGDAPFFYRFYVSDFTDLIPSRILELNLDDRRPPNLLNTSIETMRREELAGRFDVEYKLPLYRGGSAFRGVDAYGRVGVYSLASRDDLRFAIRGYEGAERIPIDLSFDIGVRADTSVGVFNFGFSSLIGFLPELW